MPVRGMLVLMVKVYDKWIDDISEDASADFGKVIVALSAGRERLQAFPADMGLATGTGDVVAAVLLLDPHPTFRALLYPQL